MVLIGAKGGVEKSHSQGDGAQVETNWRIQDRHYQKKVSGTRFHDLGRCGWKMTRQRIDWLLLSNKVYSSLPIHQIPTTFTWHWSGMVVSGSCEVKIS
jgi:hypothetical protein